MALPKFDYVRAASLGEASSLAKEKAATSILMAGGTDVILQIRDGACGQVDTVIDVKGIPGLDQLEYREGEGLIIGAQTKLFAIQTSPLVQEELPALAAAAHYVASSQVRRKGTLVGNICNASPSADTAPILLAMDAVVETYRADGGREIPIGEFFKGVKKTALDKAQGEIVTAVKIPALKSGEGAAYLKHSVRKAMDLAIIGVAAWIRMDGDIVEDVRIAMGGVGTTPLRAKEAEALLKGQRIAEELFERAGVAASKECRPISDVRASAEYRTDMIRVYTGRAIRKALETLKA